MLWAGERKVNRQSTRKAVQFPAGSDETFNRLDSLLIDDTIVRQRPIVIGGKGKVSHQLMGP